MRSSGRGFTLIEVLIALAVTALVAMLSFSSLSAVLNSVEVLRDRGQRISELNRAWTLISRDIHHFVARPVRDEYGELEAAMRGGAAVANGISFTRGGWHNPNQQLRSNLQRVYYILEDDVLWRESYATLDRAVETEPQRARLLTGVDDFQLAFLDQSIEVLGEELDTEDWHDSWGLSPGTSVAVPPPQALEIVILLQDWGEVRWLYDLPLQ